MKFIKFPVRMIGPVSDQTVEDSQYEPYSIVDSSGRVLHYPAKRPMNPKAEEEERWLSLYIIERLKWNPNPQRKGQKETINDNFCSDPVKV